MENTKLYRKPTLKEIITEGSIKVVDEKEPSGFLWVNRPDYDEWAKALPPLPAEYKESVRSMLNPIESFKPDPEDFF